MQASAVRASRCRDIAPVALLGFPVPEAPYQLKLLDPPAAARPRRGAHTVGLDPTAGFRARRHLATPGIGVQRAPANRGDQQSLTGAVPGSDRMTRSRVVGSASPTSGVSDTPCLDVRRPETGGSRPETTPRHGSSPLTRTKTGSDREETRRAAGHREPERNTDVPLASRTSRHPRTAIRRCAHLNLVPPDDLPAAGCPAREGHPWTPVDCGAPTRYPLFAGIDPALLAGVATPD